MNGLVVVSSLAPHGTRGGNKTDIVVLGLEALLLLPLLQPAYSAEGNKQLNNGGADTG